MNPSPPMMTNDQVKSGLRSFYALFGGLIAGYVVGHGWMTQGQAMALLNNEQFLGMTANIVILGAGLASAGIAMARSIINRKPATLVAEVNAMPDVAKVRMMPTPAGVALADAANAAGLPGAEIRVAS